MTDMHGAPKTSRIMYKITLPLLFIVAAIVFYSVYLAAYPFKTATITEPILITNKPVPAGSVVMYEVHQCRYTTANAHVIRRLISQDQPNLYIPLGSTDTEAPLGCYTFAPPPIILPEETPPGNYKIEFSLNFEVNPLQTIQKKVYSETFGVTESVKN